MEYKECVKCKEIKKIHAKGLCRKCYDAQPEMREKRMKLKTENLYSRLSDNELLKLMMR